MADDRPMPMTAAPARGGTVTDSAKRWPLSRIVNVAVLALLLFAVAAVTAGGIALLTLHHDRSRVLNTLDPAILQAQQLDIAMLNQETGVRGYALSAKPGLPGPVHRRSRRGEDRDRQPDQGSPASWPPALGPI